MRRGLRKTKQVIAGILSAVLLMTSLPQNSTYVYATEQAEVHATDETTQTQTETEKITDVQTDTTASEETQLQTEAEMNKTDNSEKTETEEETTKTQDSEKTETEDLQDKSNSEETNETQASTEENDKESTESDTKIQEENSEPEEVTKSEESEIESETKESETEYENKTDLQEKVVKEELVGVYQFGDSPTDNDGISAYSVNLAADTDISELEEYLYQQMKEHKETIDVESYQISIDKIGSIVSGILNEKADLYFVNKRYSYGYIQSGDSNIVTNVNLTYSNSYNDNAFQKAAKEALAVVKSGMSDLEKAIALHDYLAVNCEYDYENYLANQIPDASYTAYGILVNRTAVCQGYALAYKYLLNQIGIDCYMVSSKTMNHAWNLIELNGKYYQVDVTWDDPTWDLIGRVRHEYMFRSDADFENKCKHKDWSITKGSEIVDYKAEDTTYDTAFWLDCDSPLVLVDENCYYVTYNNTGVINKSTLSDITGSGTTVCTIGKWGNWIGAFSGLFYANGRLYYNDQSSIYSFSLDDIENNIEKREEFTADTTDGYIYGSAFCQGKVLYSLHQNPNLTAKETVLEADITIETDPSEIFVEKIELDKQTLKLTVGSTAKLQATVTPDNATDANVTWKSSDDTIATVQDGTVTAIAVGSCTITAIAGGKEAVCDVTVSASGEDIASGSYKDITWVIDANGKLTVTGMGEFSDSNAYNRAPWYENRESITSAEINVTGMTDASYMFYECKNLVDINMDGFNTGNVSNMRSMFTRCSSLIGLDLSNFDTRKVRNMTDMFHSCSNLTNLDVSGFATGNVTGMSGMFNGCKRLTSLDVNSFATGNVTSMSFMFDGCQGLTSLDVSGFTTDNVINMKYMFNGCGGLISLDVSSFVTENVTDMESMFAWCQNLSSLNVSSFATGNVTSMSLMFNGCSSLRSLDISNFDVSKVEKIRDIFASCSNLTTIHTPCNLTQSVLLPVAGTEEAWYQPDGTAVTELPQNLSYSIMITKNKPVISDDIASGSYKDITWAIDANGKLTVTGTGEFSDLKGINRAPWYDNRESITSAEINVTGMSDASYMFYDCGSLTSVDVSGFDTGNVIYMTGMFYDCSSLTSVDVSGFDTRNVTNMRLMFSGCSSLTSVDVSGFDTRNVTNMRLMFSGCSSLTSVDVSGFDTGNVIYMSQMFYDCSSLTSVDVSGFDTGNVIDMGQMFGGCSSLTSVDVSGFDTGNVTNMGLMFGGCSSLTSVDVSGFGTGKVTIISGMFFNCRSLTSVDVSRFDTGKIINMNGMFYGCSSLTSVDVSGFDTGNVTDMGDMFYDCSSLTSVDVSGFDTENVTDMEGMFFACSSLTSVDVSRFKTGKVTNMEDMFDGCKNLTSVDMSNFDLSKVEKIQGMLDNCFNLTTIYTPRNLKQSVPLPLTGTEIVWYQPDGTEITKLPQSLDYSIKITKNKIPTVSDPYITVQKIKKDYECGDILNTDDLTVTYYNSDGIAETVTDYTTNANEIDMSVPGIKILTVTYSGLTAEVELTVTSSTTTDPDKENYKVTFDLQGHGTALEEYATYTAVPKGTTITRPTDPEAEGYQFTGWYKDPDCKTLWDFEKDTIEEDTSLYAGWEITETDPVPDQQTYAVTFNLQGHGTALEEYATYTAIPKGTTIARPTSPEAEGYQFTGWYKDPDCKTLWDFEKDTIDEDTTLYAGWKLNSGSDDDTPSEDIPDGIWIAQIKDYTYTGKPIIPSVVVYFNKKRLTAGQDYTITYKNNTKAALASAAKAPTVVVKGKGNYTGTKKASFTISKIQLTEESNLKAAKIYPIGVKYTPIVTANGNVLKSGTDYKLVYCDAYGNELKKQPIKAGNYQLHITGKGNCEGEIIFAYSVSESGGANTISKGTATIANYIYGNEEPKVTLSVDGKTLTRDTDYLVSFANTYKKGTATATFIGIGNYTGTIKKNFKVQAATIQSNDIDVAKTASYEKGGARAEVSVTVNGAELVLGTDYTVSYKKNTKIGTASVVIKGKGNYTGSQTKEFKVEPKSLSADGVKIYVSDVVTGKKPAITLYDTNGKKLAANSDYKAEIDKTAHKVTISAGKNGLYKAEPPITIFYQELERGKQVTSAALNKKSNTLPKYFAYTGKEVILDKDWLTVKAGKTVLKNNEYEILGYVNNTEKGTATVIIKGCNGYGGIKMLNFKIKARGLF